MTVKKLASAVFAVSLGLASIFCFAECAYAMSGTEPGCAGRCPEERPEENAGELCCPAFIALEKAPFAGTFHVDQVPVFHAIAAAPSNPGVSAARGHFGVLPDLSPPRIFLTAHSVHAPPVSI